MVVLTEMTEKVSQFKAEKYTQGVPDPDVEYQWLQRSLKRQRRVLRKVIEGG
jgi:hypothetical protein